MWCQDVNPHYSVRRDKVPFLSGANPARQLSCVDASENASPFCVSSFVRDNGAAPPAPRLRRWNTGQLPSWPATSFPHGRPRQSPRGPERSGGPAPAG